MDWNQFAHSCHFIFEVMGLFWTLIHNNNEQYQADFKLLEFSDRQQVLKSNGWSKGFDWFSYLQPQNECTAYKLVVHGNNDIQGLIALCPQENYVIVDLVEKAPHNHEPHVVFVNTADVLFGFACKFSKDLGFEGFISFYSKTVLVNHYIRKYGAYPLGNRKLAIGSVEANRLIELYYR